MRSFPITDEYGMHSNARCLVSSLSMRLRSNIATKSSKLIPGSIEGIFRISLERN